MIIEINGKHEYNGNDTKEKNYIRSEYINCIQSYILDGVEFYFIKYDREDIRIEKETFDLVKKILLKEDEKIALNKADKELLAKVILNTECDDEIKIKMITNLFNSEEVERK